MLKIESILAVVSTVFRYMTHLHTNFEYSFFVLISVPKIMCLV